MRTCSHRADAAGLAIVRRLIEQNRIDVAVVAARARDGTVARILRTRRPHHRGRRELPVEVDPAIVPELERSITYVWRRTCSRPSCAARPDATSETLTVGFADMVGFTALSQALDAADVAAMVDRFEATAYEHISRSAAAGS